MNIYRNKQNKKLYTIEHLIIDIKYADCNQRAGVYADPYNWDGVQIKFQNQDLEKCMLFIKQNFEIVAHI